MYEDLARRLRDASKRSERLHLEAERLVDLSARIRSARRGEVSIVRCAWCERFKLGEEWLPLEAIGQGQQHVEAVLLGQATHGICPGCFRELQAETGIYSHWKAT